MSRREGKRISSGNQHGTITTLSTSTEHWTSIWAIRASRQNGYQRQNKMWNHYIQLYRQFESDAQGVTSKQIYHAQLRNIQKRHDGAWPPSTRPHDNSEPMSKSRLVQGCIQFGPNFSGCLGAASGGGQRYTGYVQVQTFESSQRASTYSRVGGKLSTLRCIWLKNL